MHRFFPLLFGMNFFFLETALPSFNEIIENALAGDVTTISLLGIGLIVCFILLILVVDLADWVIGLTKRFFLLAIILTANLLFFFAVFEKAFSAERGPGIIVAAIIGSFFAILALVISIISLKRELFKPKDEKVADLESEMKKLVAERFEEELEGKLFEKSQDAIIAGKINVQQAKKPFNLRDFLMHFQDNSSLALLSYLVVAEFGIIAALPISIESEQFGLIAFAVFLIAAMVFIKSTYKNYLKGIKYMLITLLIGAPIAIAISNAWLGIPLEQLFSLYFFKTRSVVALMVGIAIELFLGSKD